MSRTVTLFGVLLMTSAVPLGLGEGAPAAAAAPASGQARVLDVDTIIARHIEARGGIAAIRAIKTLILDKGVYKEGDTTIDGFVVMFRRPYYKVVGHPARHPDFLEGYNGTAWEWYTPQDSKAPCQVSFVVQHTGPANAPARHFSDLDGPLVDYAEKGSRAELIGTEALDGRPAYRIRLTMLDGFVLDFLIDQKSYLMVGRQVTMAQHAVGEKVVTMQRYSDYRPVGGVLFPFHDEEVEIATGRVLNTEDWGSIRVNEEMPLAWFNPPEFKRTSDEEFMEQLLIQRADPDAVLWTYHNYRRANPGTDTRCASQIVGYQMAKSEAFPAALALLTRNIADYPKSADGYFGLGRVYAAMRRKEDARKWFQRALELEPGHKRATQGLADLGK